MNTKQFSFDETPAVQRTNFIEDITLMMATGVTVTEQLQWQSMNRVQWIGNATVFWSVSRMEVGNR